MVRRLLLVTLTMPPVGCAHAVVVSPFEHHNRPLTYCSTRRVLYNVDMTNTNRIAAAILASPSHALFGAWLASLCFALGCAAN